MRPSVIALHGFLGQGSDWDGVRHASRGGLRWICPDLFGPAASSFAPPEIEGPCWLAGYSFGARLALRWMQDEPLRWQGALLLSAQPGNFQKNAERAARRVADDAWAAAFRAEAWDDLLLRWNEQPVFAGTVALSRRESDFDRTKLVAALENFSVAGQFTDPLRLPSRLVWLAGARDERFSALLDDLRAAGFPGSFFRVEGAGHRLLVDVPDAVAAALDELVA